MRFLDNLDIKDGETLTMDCPVCKGAGEVGAEDESEPCPVCRGA